MFKSEIALKRRIAFCAAFLLFLLGYFWSTSDSVENNSVFQEVSKDFTRLLQRPPVKQETLLEQRLKQVEQTEDGTFLYHPTTSKNERTNAICISGIRMDYLLIPEIHLALQQYIITAENNADIFLYGYQEQAEVNTTALLELYGDYLAGFVLKRWTETEDRKADAYSDLTPGNSRGYTSMFLSIKECHQTLLKPYATMIRHKPYDVIMRARPDMLYQTPVKMSDYASKENPKKLYFPPPHNLDTYDPLKRADDSTAILNWGDTPGLNDQSALGGWFAMDLYAMMLGFRLNMRQGTIPENAVYQYVVEMLGFDTEMADFRYDLLRR